MIALEWTWLDSWIVVTGVLSACSCALLGNFMLLRRMSMMGDAISHAVLPGLAIAFLLTESRDSVTMFVGAALVGLLTAVFTHWVNHFGQVDESASMGVVFTTLFAIGLLVIVQAADHVDLDPGCVLYGAIETVPLDMRAVAGFEVPRAALVVAATLLLNAFFVIVFYKEITITAFDPALATTVGINAQLMHYLLMTLVAVTAVAAFESVGSILVIAMLIVPAATAHLLTDRLRSMIVVSFVVAALCAALGHLGAITVPRLWGYEDTSTAGMMAVVAGLLFLLTLLGAPRYGVISQFLRRASLSLRIVREDILGLLYRMDELDAGDRGDLAPALLRDAMGTGSVARRLALHGLRREGAVRRAGAGYRLTDKGRLAGRELIRSHRLWESYLHKHLNLAADHVHDPAERLEHVTDAELRSSLAARTDETRRDPQGKTIPDDDKGGSDA